MFNIIVVMLLGHVMFKMFDKRQGLKCVWGIRFYLDICYYGMFYG